MYQQTSIPPAPVPPTPRRGRGALGCIFEIVETVILTVVLFWVIQGFVAQPFQVQQVSMLDTIQDGQYVLVDRLTPRLDPYHRGDIVVFNPEANAESPGDRPFIKRVIGIAGDKVELRDGAVYVNGIALDEPYLYAVDGVAQPTRPTPENGQESWTIPAGMLFVMGDHREASSDSRTFGPIKVEAVIGRAWLRYWPLAAFGVLPTDSHPELASPSPRPSASAAPRAKPSAKPVKATPKPARTPKP